MTPPQITRKPLPSPLTTTHPPRSTTMPNPITAYELRSWIDTIPSPLLESRFPTAHPIYSDANCRLVVQQIICDGSGARSRFLLRVFIQEGCTEMMLRAMKEEAPGAVPARCVVPVAADGARVMSAEGIRIALKKSVED
jgi:hypothetical protein